jgi:hypothetical protein
MRLCSEELFCGQHIILILLYIFKINFFAIFADHGDLGVDDLLYGLPAPSGRGL